MEPEHYLLKFLLKFIMFNLYILVLVLPNFFALL